MTSERKTIGTTAAKLFEFERASDTNRIVITIYNRGSAAIFIGGSGVTTANGFEISAGEYQIFDVIDSDPVYAISGTAGQRVDVFSQGG